jgi:hypothetical protein
MALVVASIDANETDLRHVIWCSADGTNDNGTGDTGELHSETISTSTWSVVNSGAAATLSGSLAAITIRGVVYAINTVATVTISGITAGDDGKLTLLNRIVTSGSRTLDTTVEMDVEVH